MWTKSRTYFGYRAIFSHQPGFLYNLSEVVFLACSVDEGSDQMREPGTGKLLSTMSRFVVNGLLHRSTNNSKHVKILHKST